MKHPTQLQLQQYRMCVKSFTEFTDDEWEIFTSHLYVKRVMKKELLVKPDTVCNEVCFISSGSFRFYFVKDGVEVSTYFCFQNEFISSYRSFLKQEPGGISIEAMDDAVLICFSHKSLQLLLKDMRIAYRMEQFGRKIAEYLICCYEERVMTFLSKTPEERYLQLLEIQPAFIQKIPQHYLANYLGITPVSLSRIRKRIFDNRPRQKMVS